MMLRRVAAILVAVPHVEALMRLSMAVPPVCPANTICVPKVETAAAGVADSLSPALSKLSGQP